MRLFKKKSTEILEGDLTPMIDMTFQLIAFFMLLINFSEVDRAEEILLPSSVLAVPPVVRPDYQIILNLEPNGVVVFEGQKNGIDLLNPLLSRQVDAAAREGIRDPADIAVIIRSHEDTPTGVVQELMAKCQESELQSFSLRVKNQK
ncbi:MAG: biopolymer transporter ExbD [Mariniblastus sp.]|jgi:biopolymer transport protein ExbD|nr:biopolymer transporter ExbD [Planctomycetaceae bacterium]MDB4652526.1 biopolymer transporter ExbD [bacterium]MDG1512660.1 biopolymer transporter ExbD [Mariniblastus sp.]MCP4480497.1 biopolymer transporter ExbD [Planctomycetaceae bacterium]MCP4775723.1 biopolymer transporter ExbD [Planctomycetaceae bacterium]|eukprot:COSAG01_NODE_112_length_25714_cov_36.675620_12_plen_147_part_00